MESLKITQPKNNHKISQNCYYEWKYAVDTRSTDLSFWRQRKYIHGNNGYDPRYTSN